MAIDKARVLATAQKHLARNNIDKALKELTRIVREDPKDLRVRQKVAELLAKQGKVPEAMREFQVVAEAYERGGFYPKAAAIYKQMLRFEPDQMLWHLALGEIYQQLALLSDAMDHFNRVARHFDDHGNSKERIDIYEKLLRLTPDSIEYAEKLASIYTQSNDPVGALEVYRGLAETLESRQDLEALTRVYERMSAIKTDDLTLVRALADLYLDRGDPKRALAKLQICFKADPQDTETLNLLADAFVDLGEREKAVAVLKELAQIYDSLGYEEYRNQVYDRIAEVDPEGGGDYAGDASLQLPGGEEAVEGLALTEPGPLSDESERALAEMDVYLQYGLSDKAKAQLQKAAAADPGAFEVHRALVRLAVADSDLPGAQAALGAMYEIAMDRSDFAAARACLNRAVELDPNDVAARARLETFIQGVGDLLDEEEAASVGGYDDGDLGSAIELADRIAERQQEPTAQADNEAMFEDEFDFDDEEMQRLAAELASEMTSEMSAPSMPAATRPSPPDEDEDEDGYEDEVGLDFDDPFAAMDDVGAGEGLGDLTNFDDIGDVHDADEAERLSAFQLAESYYQAGMYEDAAVEFRRAADEDERRLDALEMLGMSHRRNREFAGAVAAFREILGESLHDTEHVLRIMFELGVTYEAAGNRRGAYKIYRRVVDNQRDFRGGEVMNRVSSLALELGIKD